MKRLAGRLFFWLRDNANDVRVVTLTNRNKQLEEKVAEYRDLTVPSLRRQIDLEQAEIVMLKEKLVAWRMEVQEDIAAKESRAGDLTDR